MLTDIGEGYFEMKTNESYKTFYSNSGLIKMSFKSHLFNFNRPK